MKVPSIWLRRIHKWVGIAIGLQFLLWAISGTAMALLDMEEVAGGERAEQAAAPLPPTSPAWPMIQDAVGVNVGAMRSRTVLGRQLLEISGPAGTALIDPASGAQVRIGAPLASAIASAAYPGGMAPKSVSKQSEVTLAVRTHELPIWKVDFADRDNSSYYISGTTGELLERRNDSWRWWDFFWMLHNMDYAERTSFNHPLIIAVGIAMAWLAVTGFWLLFRTMWRHDIAWLRSRRRRGTEAG
ncbi:MAG TPA: PepSY domain-containing protein [Sphingomicrobium sp.]|nr:PepSY domain-containing protein [Sphingomicrobium sp.]